MKQLDLLEASIDKAPEKLSELEDDKDFSEEHESEVEEPHIFSVSEINGNIRKILESQFSLIWIRGEISNFKAHTSGHYYFSLKDQKAQVSCVMFKGFNSRLKFKPESGQEVLIRGKITVYEPRGNYQVFCELMEPVGAGALQMAFEQLKKKLQSEGLFALEKKRALPSLPKHIALVTSPTGAAVRDMLNVLSRRFKGARITIVPVLVQGDRAATSIVEGLTLANRMIDLDVIICGRGGGSIEDLWCFNEEIVARAIAGSRVPIVSAVGHEVDFTIADFVADLRAPTPSAAAELVVKNAQDLSDKIQNIQLRLHTAMRHCLQNLVNKVAHLEKRLIDPQRRLQDLMIRCELSHRLEQSMWRYIQDCRKQVELAMQKVGSPKDKVLQLKREIEHLKLTLTKQMQNKIERAKAKWAQQSALLDSLSPLRVVDRGYVIATKNKAVVKSVKQLGVGDALDLQMSDGRIEAEVKNIFNKEN